MRWDDLHVGEEVWSQDEFDPNAPATWKRVEEIFQTEAFICTLRVAGQEIKTTGEHPFWVAGKGWTAVNQLQPGDKLRGDDGQLYPVESVTATDEWLPVYNARIADYHTYYVCAPDGNVWLWAHNSYNRAHANRRLSRRVNHGYVIVDDSGAILKYGISSGRVSQSGIAYRAARQVSALRKAGVTASTKPVTVYFKNRAQALAWELAQTRAYQAAHPLGLRPPLMKRP